MTVDPDPNVQMMKDLNPEGDPPPVPDDENVHGETPEDDGTPGSAPPKGAS